jgi:hypothetical protein
MVFQTHPKDLSAQKLVPSAPPFLHLRDPDLARRVGAYSNLSAMQTKSNFTKLAVPLSLVMLAAWAVVTFAYEAPGWVHMLLTGGVFLLIYGIVARGTPSAGDGPAPR